jgi:hypothetical protein
MRWKEPEPNGPKWGDRRMKTKFLLFPKCMRGEWRWLETAYWMQEYEFRSTEDYYYGKWADQNDEPWVAD